MKQLKWEKSGLGNSIEEIIEAKSGCTISELKNPPERYITGMAELALELFSIFDQKVFIVGDYDCDGITSSLILHLILDILGTEHEVYIPRRLSDGYGINPKIADKAKDYDIVITIDNGIVANDVVNSLSADGKRVFIIDHHKGPEDGILPNAEIIIDPEATEDDAFTHYCAAGLAMKLADEVCKIVPVPNPVYYQMQMLAAIGTVGDVMPLIDDNRNIVNEGLKWLNLGHWRDLTDQVFAEKLSAKDIAFQISPLINAYGRMEDEGSAICYQILLDSLEGKDNKIPTLKKVNEKRKELQKKLYTEMYKEFQKLPPMNPIFIKADAPEGLIGVLAGKLAEETGISAFVFTETEEGYLKGSARSNGELHIKDFMDENKSLFDIKYGGHEGAGGCSISKESFDILQKNAESSSFTVKEKTYSYDMDLKVLDVRKTMRELKALEPFGEGMEKPVFRIKLELVPKSGAFYKEMNGGTIKLHCDGFSAVGFGMKEKYFDIGKPYVLEAIGTLGINTYRGTEYVNLEMIDLKPIIKEEKKPENKLLSLLKERAEEIER